MVTVGVGRRLTVHTRQLGRHKGVELVEVLWEVSFPEGSMCSCSICL